MKKAVVLAVIASLLTSSLAFAATKKVDPGVACEKLAAKKHITEDKKDAFVAKCVKQAQKKKK